jgi:hypothetical protein
VPPWKMRLGEAWELEISGRNQAVRGLARRRAHGRETFDATPVEKRRTVTETVSGSSAIEQRPGFTHTPSPTGSSQPHFGCAPRD